MENNRVFLILLLLISCGISSQNLLDYQLPVDELRELIDYPKSPTILIDKKQEKVVLLHTETYKKIEDIATDQINLAGLNINPLHQNYVYKIQYKYLRDNEIFTIEDIPANAKLGEFTWSPDHTKLAFTNRSKEDIELWCYDFSSKKLFRKLMSNLNSSSGKSFSWFKDSKSLLVKIFPSSHRSENDNKINRVNGPTIYFNGDNSKKQLRTYSNLIKNVEDEVVFENAIVSELYKVSLDGDSEIWKNKDFYIAVNISPDGEYVLTTTLKKPFSYKVLYTRFERRSIVYDKQGNFIQQIEHKPATESLPVGAMAVSSGKRFLSWRSDKPSTLFWVEALDSEVSDIKDGLFQLDGPFDQKPVNILKIRDRYKNIIWGDSSRAIVYTTRTENRNIKAILFDPSDQLSPPTTIEDRNYQDIYSNPGSFELRQNEYNRSVLNIINDRVCLVGQEYTQNKKMPFIDMLNLITLKKERLFEFQHEKKVNIVSISNLYDKGEIIMSIESPSEFPNLYIYHISDTTRRLFPITSFNNPFQKLEGVQKRVVQYKRSDGLELSGMLYLPSGYDFENKPRLPLFMWAYPKDYNDRKNATQMSLVENGFTYLTFPSPVYWVNRGYAVFDEVAFPIIEGGVEPSDNSFIDQLILNAEAAIEKLDSLGFINTNKVAIGGHSYGAFMVANLLTHSHLFSAGIALSGAYNRTLTPFGFQNEKRSYWEAPEVYNDISPFMHADKMKFPLLLIHGSKDSNTGTSIIQSERYYDALRSLGATSRLVILPYEDHSYEAYESIMHITWEIDQWLEKYVKP